MSPDELLVAAVDQLGDADVLGARTTLSRWLLNQAAITTDSEVPHPVMTVVQMALDSAIAGSAETSRALLDAAIHSLRRVQYRSFSRQ